MGAQICVFSQLKIRKVYTIIAVSVIDGKESDSAANSIYENNLHRITG